MRPPEIRYGICSNSRVVCAEPYQASSTRTAPNGIRIEPTVSSVRSVTTNLVRRRSAVRRSDSDTSDVCSIGDEVSAGCRERSVIAANASRGVERTDGWRAVDDVVSDASEPEEQQPGAENAEHRLTSQAVKGRGNRA